jgi:hypothetical protein
MIAPFGEKNPVASEFLNASVTAVSDIDVTDAVCRDSSWAEETPSPLTYKPAIRSKLLDPMVPPISHIDIAHSVNSDTGCFMELCLATAV